MDSLGSDFISRGKLILKIKEKIRLGFPGSSDGKKKIACNAGDPGLIPGSGIFSGEGWLAMGGLPFLSRELHGQTMGSQRVRHH